MEEGIRQGLTGATLGVDGLAVAVALGLALVTVLVVALWASFYRRALRHQVRELTIVAEDLRSGGAARARADVDARSPLAGLAETLNRLATEVGVKRVEADRVGEEFRGITEAVRDLAVFTTDVEGDIATYSHGAELMFGWTEDEVHSRSAAILFDEESWKELVPKLARRSLRERGLETRATLKRRDGSALDAQLVVRQLRPHAGRPPGFLVVVRDIGAQVRLEGDLRDAEARWRAMLDALPTPLLVVRDGIVLRCDGDCGLLGAARDDLSGKRFRDLFATGDVLIVHDTLARLEEGSTGRVAEVRAALVGPRGAPGPEVRLLMRAAPHDGRASVEVLVVDADPWAAGPDALLLARRRLEAIADAFPVAAAVLEPDDASATVTLANRAMLDALAAKPPDLIGRPAAELVSRLGGIGADPASIASWLDAKETPRRVREMDLVGDAGASWRVVSAPILGHGGAVEGRLLVLLDTSAARNAASLLASAEQEVRRVRAEAAAGERAARDGLEVSARRVAELERLQREMRTLLEMKSNLLANVTHELQTPLVSVRGYTEMTLRERLGTINEEQKKALSHSLRNIDRLIGLIDNLLAFTRMDEDAAALRLESFPLKAVVEEAMEMLRAPMQAQEVTSRLSLEDPAVRVHADREKILQVFTNLLSNAVKFNRRGGRVDVEVRPGSAPDQVQVVIRDTGIGIPQEELDRVFDRFYRSEGTGAKGTGLGLAIVKDLLRLHGCSIRAESGSVGGGTTIRFTLPRSAAVAERPPSDPSGGPPSAAGTSRGEVPSSAEVRSPAAETVPPSESPSPTAEATGHHEPGRPRPRFRVIRRST